MISLIFCIIFFVLFVFFCVVGGNYALKNMIDSILTKSENFENINEVNPIDDCKKIDLETEQNLNFQTATNIPLSPNYYKNYVGSIYMDNDKKNDNELKNGLYCLKKSKLLYDGIWNPIINKESPYEYESWELTNGNLSDDYYCSDKLIEVNAPFPENYIDKSAVVTNNEGGDYYTYFNDTHYDIFDTELECFPQIFNQGIYK